MNRVLYHYSIPIAHVISPHAKNRTRTNPTETAKVHDNNLHAKKTQAQAYHKQEVTCRMRRTRHTCNAYRARALEDTASIKGARGCPTIVHTTHNHTQRTLGQVRPRRTLRVLVVHLSLLNGLCACILTSPLATAKAANVLRVSMYIESFLPSHNRILGQKKTDATKHRLDEKQIVESARARWH